MRGRLLLVSSALLAVAFSSAPARAGGWALADERRMAADAASFAPPDFKRQLARHSRRFMQGVSDAAAAETGARATAAHREAAARGARALAESIRGHTPFDEIAYQAGGIVHELAMAVPPAAAPAADTSVGARFLGFSAEPFAAPEKLSAASLPSRTPRECYDASITLTARLLAWIWRTAGGDVSSVTQYPASKGPYAVRE
ncbi:MAG TPA: hypothetical protein VLJ18_08580 [Thermoanaerobaculia bacterium]|nr:hypothetical protein [Thermoanaerobaculia bacterium]